MVERICMNGAVRLVFQVGPIPIPNTVHNVQWIRQHAGANGSSERVLSFIQQVPQYAINQAPNAGLITVTIRLNLVHMYIAHELVAYPAGFTAAVRHEEGHVPAWDRAMASSLADISTELGSRITPPPTLSQVHSIVAEFTRQWSLCCRLAADTWDSLDYPRLHRELQSAGVPTL